MNFDWTKPLVIDWSGSSPLITEHDIKNSVIKRILHNQFNPPFCERENIPVKPWWNPQDPFVSRFGNNNIKHTRFIPGLRPLPVFPQQSTLTKEQHLQGLKVLSTRFEFVQPRNYLKPTQEDIDAFEEFQSIYEAEQKEYHKWAKLLWLNGNCLRALRPKPLLERVYEAEFKMRAHEMLSMPQKYSLAAQIPLQKDEACEMELLEELINVNIEDLPEVDYPEVMESDFSVLMKSCPLPEPCKVHPCKFVLPHEETPSVLPLSEIHCELAHYAASNDSSVVASESALRCLLDLDRGWKIPVSVVEVECPEYGDVKTIVVLGSEFNVQKECSTQRTYRAYKHLLRHTFAPSMGQYKSKSTKQNTANEVDKSPPVNKEASAPRNNRFVSLDDDLDVSSDEDDNEKLLIADSEKKNEPKKLQDLSEHSEPSKESRPVLADNYIINTITSTSQEPNKPDYMNECSEKPGEPDQLMIDKHNEINKVSSNDIDINKPDNFNEFIDEPSSEPDQLMVDNPSNTSPLFTQSLDFYGPDKDTNNTNNYSHNEPFQLSTCGLDFYQPDYSINTRPNYSRDTDDPSSEPDKLVISNTSNVNEEVVNKFRQEKLEARWHCDKNYDEQSHSNKLNSEPNEIDSFSECNSETNGCRDYELDCDTTQINNKLSEPINDKSNIEPNTKNIDLNGKTTKSNTMTKIENNASLGSKQNTAKCESGSATTKASSPIKACRISVRNLGISELDAFNIAALLNNPKTEAPEKNHFETFNDDISILNGDPEKSTEGPARLGISGIITRNRSSISANKPVETIKPVVETKDSNHEVQVNKQHRMLTSNCVSDVDKQKNKILGLKNNNNNNTSGSKITKIDDHIIEIAKEATNLAISGIVTRNRSPSETDNEAKLKTCRNVNKTFTSPTKNLSTEEITIGIENNIFTRSGKTSNVDPDKNFEMKLNTKNLQRKQNTWEEGEVNESTSRKSLELSPVKPYSVPLEPIEVEPYVRKRISETSLTECEHIDKLDNNTVDGSKVLTKIVENFKSAAKTPTRKRSIIESNTESTDIELHNRKTNVKTYARKSGPNKSKPNPCINKNSPIDTVYCNLKESNQPRPKRVRKLSKQVILDNEYCQSDENLNTKPQERSVTDMEHDYCNKEHETSDEQETGTNMLFVDCQPAIDKYIREFDNLNTFTSLIPKENLSTTSNVRNKSCFSKTASRKVSLGGLFGVESDSDESTERSRVSNTTEEQVNDSKKLSFSDPIDEPITVKSSLESCLTNNNSDTSRNSKRKLSVSDPEFSFSEPDSEDAIAGFTNGVAVLRKPVQKKQHTVTRSYGLRSKNKTNTARTVKSKSKTSDRNEEKGRFTKISPISKRKRNACSKSDNDDDSVEQNISLRRSKRITNVDNFDEISKVQNKSKAKESTENSKRLKRSRRVSDRSSPKENLQPKTIQNRNILAKPVKKILKIVKRDETRRKSLPSNTFSERAKRKPMLRSKSLSNIYEITEIKRTRHSSESVSCSTRSKTFKTSNKDVNDSLKLSQRTKRYLRRILNVDCSESDESADDISQSTERNIHSSSDTEIITKLCTRSSIASRKGTTKTNKSRNKDYLGKCKRYGLRSSAANSSCDEIEKSDQVRKSKTKKNKAIANFSTNGSAQSNVELCKTDEPKPESNGTTEIVEKYKIEIDITEETSSVDDTLQALHFTEMPNSCKGNTTQADIQETVKVDDGHINMTTKIFTRNSTDTPHVENSVTEIIASKKISKHNAVDVDSESFDFFNMCVNDEFNILHFTATNETDSEDESLSIDDAQPKSKATKIESKNDKVHIIHPKRAQTELGNVFGESSEHRMVQASTSIESIKPQSSVTNKETGRKKQSQITSDKLGRQNTKSKDVNDSKETHCTCKGTPFEIPPPRSFKKWRVRNKVTHVGYNVIVHSAHKVRRGGREVVLEPQVEFQPELGGARRAPGRARALQLALVLRDAATLLNVRIDHDSGNVLVIEPVSESSRDGSRAALAHTVYAALDQLSFLMPGQYVLAHDPSHGTNAMLYTSKGVHDSSTSLNLQQANINMPDAEDALFAKIYPELDLVLLPYHKHRGILPLAFTPMKLVKEDKKMAAALARAKPPPSAIQWPKKKKRSKKRATRQPANLPQE